MFIDSRELNSDPNPRRMVDNEQMTGLFQLDQHYFAVLRADDRFVMFFVDLNDRT